MEPEALTTTPWADLPSAAVIDAILADGRARPEVWDLAWSATWSRMWAEAWAAVQPAVQIAASSAVWREIGTVVRDVLAALIMWPESAALLDLTPDAVRTIIDTCEGDARHQAVLLLPAVIAKHTT